MADNSSRKFKFISPGVFIDEIDNSQLPAEPTSVGPMIIGRARKGPAMKPVQVNSFNDFVDTFGNPVAGGSGGDVWRDGNTTSPMYAPYAAQAWLRSNSPLTFMRLVGQQDSNADATNRNGQAGWYGGNEGKESGFSFSTPADGGAWALCVFPTSSGVQVDVTGAVAAVFYADAGRLMLSGNTAANAGLGALTASACTVFQTGNGDLTLAVSKAGVDSVSVFQKKSFSLRPDSANFIRNVFNTNPTIVNDEITTPAAQSASLGGQFWLGQSYERSLSGQGINSLGILSDDLGSGYSACLIPMVDDGGNFGHNFKFPAQRGSTGWFISQDLSSNTGSYVPREKQQLFRLEALSAGDWAQNEIKISISNIKAPAGDFQTFGSFSVLLRSINDTDNEQVIIERYDGLDLNPASPNYIARIIGDTYEKYDSVAEANRSYGQYENRSNYVRVVMNEDIDRGGMDARLLPFGVFGPLKYRDVSFHSGSRAWNPAGDVVSNYPPGIVLTALSGGTVAQYGQLGGHRSSAASAGMISLGAETDNDKPFTATIRFPVLPLRQKRDWASPKNNKNCFWGAWTGRTTSNAVYNDGLVDYLRPVAKSFSGYNNPAGTSHDVALPTGSGLDPANQDYIGSQAVEISWVFSLDDVSGSVDSNGLMTGGRFANGARVNGTSRSAITSWSGSLSSGIDRFTTCLAGGFEGFDITERDPLRLGASGDAGGFYGVSDEKLSYQLATIKQAINMVSDAEDVQYNIVTIPGIINNAATQYLLDKVEERADALAVIDIQGVYTPSSENASTEEERNSSLTVKNLVDNFEARSINNSYGATYAPWVLIQDTITNRSLWVPPSVPAIGALSTTDKTAAPWYAPAGFARGGLSEGAAGIPVLNVSRRLNSDDRDNLYEANINPIAKFPAEGIVVFGQKTLQQTRSALDRINVRRLLIYLKREISFIASRLLFAPNTRDTWTRFIGQATPVLDSVKAQFGIEDFRLILDESTTTPDLIDRNILYAKLLVKPTRAAEFFAIDFVITNTGAAFED